MSENVLVLALLESVFAAWSHNSLVSYLIQDHDELSRTSCASTDVLENGEHRTMMFWARSPVLRKVTGVTPPAASVMSRMPWQQVFGAEHSLLTPPPQPQDLLFPLFPLFPLINGIKFDIKWKYSNSQTAHFFTLLGQIGQIIFPFSFSWFSVYMCFTSWGSECSRLMSWTSSPHGLHLYGLESRLD